MRASKNNLAYLLHIRDSLEKISSYTTSHTFQEFDNHDWDQSAVLRYLEVIGEAANKIEAEFRQAHPEIPWREVTDLRNVIIHDYMNVDSILIWKIITTDVPTLEKQVQSLISNLEA